MMRKQRKAFSLVELVIVIVILAVISAIALPRISRGAKGADDSAVGQNLSILRSAIDMYAAEHKGKFPAEVGDGTNAAASAEAFENQLTMYTKADGTFSETYDKANGFIYGPYLHKLPPLTVGANSGSADVTIVTGATAPAVGGTTGWVYNSDTGKIIANCGDTADSGTTYDTW